MANDGVVDSGLAGNGAEAISHALGMPIAVAPDEMTIVKLSGCRDKACAFFGDQMDPWGESVGPLAGASSTSVAPRDPGSAGLPSFPSIGAAAVQLQGFPGMLAEAPPWAAYAASSYSPSAAVEYARKWALSPNPDYEHFDRDCTNFVSQALFAGGWSMVWSPEVCDDVVDNKVWWFRRDACWHLYRNTHCSWTWSLASRLHWFLRSSARAAVVNNVWDLEPGDVLQKDCGDDYVRHSIMLTKKTEDNLYFCGHSTDYLDEPFYGEKSILGRNSNVKDKWYGFHVI